MSEEDKTDIDRCSKQSCSIYDLIEVPNSRVTK